MKPMKEKTPEIHSPSRDAIRFAPAIGEVWIYVAIYDALEWSKKR
jgi:hypothetical protein